MHDIVGSVRKPLVVTFLLALVGCTSLLGDFEVTSGSPGCTPCGGTCVDINVDPLNCGACGVACNGGQKCNAGVCGCAADEAFCNGQCGKADRMRCGPTCTPCQEDEVCSSGCVPAPLPAWKKVPLRTTGWLVGAESKPLEIEVEPTGIPNTIYECRTGPNAIFTPTVPAWGPCDGGDGSGTIHRPKEHPGTPEGTYRTEYRYRSDTFRSDTLSTVYYVHHKLDGVATCPRPGVAGDVPSFTDEQFFAAAEAYSGANPNVFPTTGTFVAPSNPPVRTDENHLLNPFIKVTFRGVTILPATNSSGLWPPDGGDYVLEERSLRHVYAFNPNRTLLLVRRQYVHPTRGDCRDVYKFGNRMALHYGPTDLEPLRGMRRIDCEALVLNSRGGGICLGRQDGMAVPTPRVISRRLTQGFQPSGTLTYTDAGGATLSSSANYGFLAGGNYYVFLISSGSGATASGRWFKVQASTATTVTLTENPRDFGYFNGTAYNFRYSNEFTDITFVPTMFTKLFQEDGQLWKFPCPSGNPCAHSPPYNTPSFRTKCEGDPSCNAGKPWLTYLPP